MVLCCQVVASVKETVFDYWNTTFHILSCVRECLSPTISKHLIANQTKPHPFSTYLFTKCFAFSKPFFIFKSHQQLLYTKKYTTISAYLRRSFLPIQKQHNKFDIEPTKSKLKHFHGQLLWQAIADGESERI